MKRLIPFLILLLTSITSFSQTYYVSSTSLTLRSEPSLNAEVLVKLSRYDKLELDSLYGDWIKVSFNDQTGFVSSSLIKKGRAEVTYYSVRTGAVCKDGTSSSATGRGACSHHGGVARWKTAKKERVRIVDN